MGQSAASVVARNKQPVKNDASKVVIRDEPSIDLFDYAARRDIRQTLCFKEKLPVRHHEWLANNSCEAMLATVRTQR